ncbi:hypothetical protein EVJ58_g4208 [Rhodofomes roseus]|uniref:Uncharacterized protein n=1 Tax=Rhodofomes roseus TaxID=34475 RepID=A0A4Y9YKB1_9APHY|nr:hypothetical protein EVJ58_g4208 [Rhodofomes roseus]
MPPSNSVPPFQVLFLDGSSIGSAVARAQWDVVYKLAPLQDRGIYSDTEYTQGPSPSSPTKTSSTSSTSDYEYHSGSASDSADEWESSTGADRHGLSMPVFRASPANDPRDPYTRGQFIGVTHKPTTSRAAQIYVTHLLVVQSVPAHMAAAVGSPAGSRFDTQFRVVIDTGSNISWLHGVGVKDGAQPSVQPFIHNGVEILETGNGPPSRMRLVSHPHDMDDPERLVRWPEGSFVNGQVMYMDGSIARFTLARHVRHNVTIARCFHWNGSNWTANIPFRYKFGMTYEVVSLDHRYDGMLGLGLSVKQSNIEDKDINAPVN